MLLLKFAKIENFDDDAWHCKALYPFPYTFFVFEETQVAIREDKRELALFLVLGCD